jgi:hypothetical protein
LGGEFESLNPFYWLQHNIRRANVSFHRKKPLHGVLSPFAKGRDDVEIHFFKIVGMSYIGG